MKDNNNHISIVSIRMKGVNVVCYKDSRIFI